MTPLPRLLADGHSPASVVARRGSETLPFARFRADVAAAASRFRRGRWQRGGLVCRDSYLFIVGMFGLMAAGAEVVIPPNSRPGTLAALADAWDVLVTDDRSLPEPRVVIPACEAEASVEPAIADGRIILFTSGSTGEPKRVVRGLTQLDREIAELERLWGETAGDAIVHSTVPHHHIYGLTFARLWPLAAGRSFSTAVYEVWDPLIVALAAPAIVISSPAHLSRLGGLTSLARADGPRLVFSAGAPLSRAAASNVASVLGVLPTEIFGSTETGAIATRVQHADAAPWQPLPGISVDRHEDGHLRVRSPWVDDGQWFDTEDCIERAGDDGAFHLVGRADRVVKIEGKRIALAEIEQRLVALPWVTEAAVVALPGEPATLAAAVVLTADGRAEHQRRGAFRFARTLRHALSPFHDPASLPRRWRFVAQLPTGTMGKPSASAIAALFEGGLR